VAPGEEIELALPVTAPSVPGRYQLELDMVQDGVGWFAQRGSPTLRVPVEVRPGSPEAVPAPSPKGAPTGDGDSARATARATATANAPAEQEQFQPRIEMYSVAREQVLEVVRAGGGVVVHAFADVNAGPDFEGLRYVVRREAPTGWRPGGPASRAVDALVNRLDMLLPPPVAP